MHNISDYFQGERVQCITGISISLVCIGLSVYFLTQQSQVLKGIAYTFIPLSLLLVVICTGIVLRTSSDINRVTGYYEEGDTRLKSEELPRMENVMRNFGIIKKVELVILLAGVVLGFVFRKNELVLGIAVGMIVQGIILYLFDHFAEQRGFEYMDFLRSV